MTIGAITLASGTGSPTAAFLSDIVPVASAHIMIGAGAGGGCLALTMLYAITSPPAPKQRVALGVTLALTLAVLLLYAAATGLAFAYDHVAALAAREQFAPLARSMGWLETEFYTTLQAAFMKGFTACDPSSFLTTQARNQCSMRDYKLAYKKSQPSRCTQLPVGYVGLFCKKSAGNVDFDVDRILAFPDPALPFAEVEGQSVGSTSDFAMWVNWACMPTYSAALRHQTTMNGVEVSAHAAASTPPDGLGAQLQQLLLTSSRGGTVPPKESWALLKDQFRDFSPTE